VIRFFDIFEGLTPKKGLCLKKSNKPTISLEMEIEKYHLRQSAKTVPLFKTGEVR